MQENNEIGPAAAQKPPPAGSPATVPSRRGWLRLPTLTQSATVLLCLMSACVLIGLVVFVVTLLLMGSSYNAINDDFDRMLDWGVQVDALNAAGAFGDGANGQLIKSVTAVTNAIRDNLLGLAGATFVLVLIGLAIALMWGDERATERTTHVVKGVFMLVAATGFVA